MTEPTRYGQSQTDKIAGENEVCRHIVTEINSQGGLTQRQTLFLIYLLALELENVGQMQALTRLVRDLGGDGLFLTGTPSL